MAKSEFSLSSKFSEKPPFCSMDNSKRTDDLTKKYSVFEVNYDGMLFELPLSLEIGLTIVEGDGDMKTMYDMAKLRKGIEFQGKNMYAEFLHADCVDYHYDALDYWKYEDVYISGCWDVGGSSTDFDWINEHVGYDEGSLPAISKDVFSKDVVLDAGGSSSLTSLSFVLKKKCKIRVKFTRKRAILKRS
ncbi:hypothetical protein Tco_1524209 [Tanacetum coccineum]